MQVRALLVERRLTVGQAARELGVSAPTVCYYARKLGIERAEPRHYDWEDVQRYYDQGHSVAACRVRFGMANRTITDAVRRGELITRPQAAPVGEVFTTGHVRNRGHLKRRMLDAGLRDDRCERCGIDEWRGRPLSMQLHHVNGRTDDHRLENLQLLCANCHSQTDNHSRKQRHEAASDDAGA